MCNQTGLAISCACLPIPCYSCMLIDASSFGVVQDSSGCIDAVSAAIQVLEVCCFFADILFSFLFFGLTLPYKSLILLVSSFSY